MPIKHFLLLFFFPLWAAAQNSVTISGKVLDQKTKLPLEASTVYITNVADSAVVDYTISSKDGTFSLTTRKLLKPVSVKVSFIGFKTSVREFKQIQENLNLGIFELEEADNVLGEVVVISETPPIRIKKDTLEFNASSFKVRPDANVETLLKQLPGVEIDADGKITVNGKEVNQILVNGKPFFDADGKIALQNLPSDIINKVQISDTKTKEEEIAGKKATADNASINLTIDEDKNKGFFGKATVGYGSDQRYESSLLVNHFKGKRKVSLLASSNNINSTGFSMNEIFDSMGGGRNTSMYMFDNGGFGLNGMRFGGGNGITRTNLVGASYADEWFKGVDANASYFYTGANNQNTNRTRLTNLLPSGNQVTRSASNTEDDRFAHNLNTNFTFKLDSTATVFMNPRLTASGFTTSVTSEESTIDPEDRLLNEFSNSSTTKANQFTFSNDINFFKGFKRKGKSVSLNVMHENSREDNDRLFESAATFYNDNDNDGQTDETVTDNRNQFRNDYNTRDFIRLNGEFQVPVRDSLSMQFDASYSLSNQLNRRQTFDFDAGSQAFSGFNDAQSFYLSSITETITPMIGLVLWKSKFDFNASFGTAVSSFRNSSFYVGQETSLDKKYLFPEMNFNGSYRFSKSKNMYLSYNYGVDFPTARQVLPVEDLSNPLQSTLGNPDLEPNQYHRMFMNFRDYDFASKSGYSFYGGFNIFEKQTVTSTVFEDNGRRFTTFENVSGTFNSWFGGNLNKSVKKEAHSYRFNLGISGGINRSKGFINEESFTAQSYRLGPNANFTYEYGELFTLNPSYNLSYNVTQYDNYSIDQASNVNHRLNLQITSYWPKNVVFGNDFGYTYNSNIADGFRKDFYLWNTSLGYHFYDKQFLFKVKVYDVLNQNLNATRFISATFIRDEQNTVLQRYVMFSLTYTLSKFAGKKTEERRFH